MSTQCIGIVGAGLMGHGIAQVFACAGRRVAVYEPDSQRRAGIVERIRGNLVALGKNPAAADLVSPCAAIEDAVGAAEVVFEAVPENLDLKRSLFAQIESAAPPHALLASNTSVIPITQIMADLRDKSRALGTHWWNPPYLIPLVEVVQTLHTDPKAIETMCALLRDAGKHPVHVRRDVPGFIGNRLQHAMWREAIALVEQGVCEAATIDEVVKASFGRRLAVLGPMENADLVGTDLTLAVHEYVLPHLDNRPAPSPLLRELVAAGRLGMKAGSGFQNWTPQQQVEIQARLAACLNARDPAA